MSVRFLKNDCDCDMSTANNNGATPVYAAAEQGHENVLQFLKNECNCDMSTTANDGATPVFVAAQQGHVDALRFLKVDCDCDMFTPRNDGTRPKYFPAKDGLLEVLKLFDDNEIPSIPSQRLALCELFCMCLLLPCQRSLIRGAPHC